jgi:hypothetical protein
MGISYIFASVADEETQFILQSAIPNTVREAQQSDRLLQQVRARISEGRTGEFTIDGTEAVRFRGRLCVPQTSQVKEDILSDAYHTPYTIHPGETKMYQDLKKTYWW